jgi:hypothetical protein
MARKREDEKPKGKPATARWMESAHMYLEGESILTEVDLVARDMEAKWGVGRLRLVVSAELRAKFDRQRLLLNNAVWEGEIGDVRLQARRQIAAYRTLDAHADANAVPHVGAMPGECIATMDAHLPDGSVLIVVQDNQAMQHAGRLAAGRNVVVWSMEEVVALIQAHGLLGSLKAAFPGATVEPVRKVADPLDGLVSGQKLDDPLPFGQPEPVAALAQEDDEWA